MRSQQRQVKSTSSYNYLLFLPEHYETQQQWPTILFLHGSGERGSKLDQVKKHGIARIVEEQPSFPFIVASPQCPQNQSWSVPLLSLLLDEVISSYHVDPDRVYLTGMSMGGYGTWDWATAQPHRFAAIAPICGGGNPDEACNLKKLTVWAFHGALDTAVPLSASEVMIEAIKACDGNVLLTVYPEAGHDSWTQTYNNPELYEWFLQHQRGIR